MTLIVVGLVVSCWLVRKRGGRPRPARVRRNPAALGMRAGIIVNVTPADRRRLEAIVADRGAPQKHVWRANIILATADGCGTAEILSLIHI